MPQFATIHVNAFVSDLFHRISDFDACFGTKPYQCPFTDLCNKSTGSTNAGKAECDGEEKVICDIYLWKTSDARVRFLFHQRLPILIISTLVTQKAFLRLTRGTKYRE
jgi:hypothetical protein